MSGRLVAKEASKAAAAAAAAVAAVSATATTPSTCETPSFAAASGNDKLGSNSLIIHQAQPQEVYIRPRGAREALRVDYSGAVGNLGRSIDLAQQTVEHAGRPRLSFSWLMLRLEYTAAISLLAVTRAMLTDQCCFAAFRRRWQVKALVGMDHNTLSGSALSWVDVESELPRLEDGAGSAMQLAWPSQSFARVGSELERSSADARDRAVVDWACSMTSTPAVRNALAESLASVPPPSFLQAEWSDVDVGDGSVASISGLSDGDSSSSSGGGGGGSECGCTCTCHASHAETGCDAAQAAAQHPDADTAVEGDIEEGGGAREAGDAPQQRSAPQQQQQQQQQAPPSPKKGWRWGRIAMAALLVSKVIVGLAAVFFTGWAAGAAVWAAAAAL
eukprot:TRINITY_DN1017_c1_g5_i1.p1 TRINITY_DN1017_c1_g5~~TRINITY_DN1017_c1_g5_i1.p1  ORF type:complete len:402 (+),score=131.53 TRINITY_DN1017_c1_g5_i1:40-1206(+)